MVVWAVTMTRSPLLMQSPSFYGGKMPNGVRFSLWSRRALVLAALAACPLVSAEVSLQHLSTARVAVEQNARTPSAAPYRALRLSRPIAADSLPSRRSIVPYVIGGALVGGILGGVIGSSYSSDACSGLPSGTCTSSNSGLAIGVGAGALVGALFWAMTGGADSRPRTP